MQAGIFKSIALTQAQAQSASRGEQWMKKITINYKSISEHVEIGKQSPLKQEWK